ncbi:6,7-dimethyl-8-ribityllumazine synthase [Suillus fuscotomentosus]|uniref:6,7-dimethyl-8-ribityllumazine synthase n=1 Tax=Suillus fuscotomentosus TaxID=1912939 RepID=A0AAD4ED04_9AGAM|nr:6,7-dimethyl-8-ribityllumazine synthase [Suillus fuscotomentosus]KAG1903892.1 6,7-dimethyl-8-ribityllumazine synthase [Suillus fuscotomentosus]
MSSIKGPSSAQFDGSSLRIAIVHARWNKTVIDSLVAGAINKLKACGVKDSNIIVQSVPGSFELPFACSKMIAGSYVQAATSSRDLLGLNFGGSSTSLPSNKEPSAPTPTLVDMPNAPFDAVVAIGVLIKGSTMHFEYICDSVSHALMRIQIDTGVPVIFGVLTALTEDQALERAGLGRGAEKGHNHGEDWGLAAVEMGTQSKRWAEGKFL